MPAVFTTIPPPPEAILAAGILDDRTGRLESAFDLIDTDGPPRFICRMASGWQAGHWLVCSDEGAVYLGETESDARKTLSAISEGSQGVDASDMDGDFDADWPDELAGL